MKFYKKLTKMVVWSVLRPVLFNSTIRNSQNAVLRRHMSEHRVFPYQPSRFQWKKFKDLIQFYVAIGVIPLTLVTLYANIFVGPATLTEIPEGYEPKYWEYSRSPVTRFMVKYFFTNPQQEYEKYLHYIFEEGERVRIRALEKAIKAKMAERSDYQAYYYRPVLAKYHRVSKEAADYLESIAGE